MKRYILIIPDVHGRKFWRRAIKDWSDKVEKVVFLGDYLDPYPFERESPTFDLAWEGLLDIIELKKSDPEKIILLEGNHDAHYHYLDTFGEWGRGSRFDYNKARKINKLFKENESLFQAAFQYQFSEDGEVFLFTHAGLCKGWAEQNKLTIPDTPDLAWWLNNMLKTCEQTPHNWMGDVGSSRGGWCPSGSPLWADWDGDHYTTSKFGLPNKPEVYQIFGHTLGTSPLRISDYCACLDCKRPFLLNENGILGEIESAESDAYWEFIINSSGLDFREWRRAYEEFTGYPLDF